jgi:DNA invertase Pin-like site-specific DNA recombinase
MLRQFSDNDSLLRQRASILSYIEKHRISLEGEMIEFDGAGKELKERRNFHEFIHSLSEGDELMVECVSALGNGIEEVVVVINCLLSRGIVLHVTSSDLTIGKETELIQVLPLIMNLDAEEKESMTSGRVGRPRGRRSSSKFDSLLPDIVKGIKENTSVSAMARQLGVSRSSLKDYIESRHLREILDDSWIERAKADFRTGETAEPEMVCTLEEIS